MTLRKACGFSLALVLLGVSCGDSDDAPSNPAPPVEEAGSGGTGGTGASEQGGTGGTGARGGTGNQGNQGGEGASCEPVECALRCNIADGVPEKGEPCTEIGNHCKDAVFDAGSCECKTTDYYCCDEEWTTTRCAESLGGAGGVDSRGVAGAP